MAIEQEDFVQSDDDFDDKKHEKLLDTVLGINKAQQLKKASRTEPALKISEFDLAKSITGKKGIVHIGDLTNILEKKKIHAAIKKKVDNSNKISTTLPKPLEKNVADKISRAVAYEKARLELDRWEPIITANRASNDLVFPLPTRDDEKNIDLTKKWRLKTAFDIEMEKNNPQLVEEIHVIDTEKEKVKLTLEELKKMRSEQAKLRAHQSYQEAKARRQNKIKSKKYHRIENKKRIKDQLKEFEELQKTNPDEALKRLEEIERIRAQERFTLRHKSTGKWAKSKQIRAKYDKESRAELAEQLRLSKELTQKTKAASDSEDEFVPQSVDVDSTKQGILWSDNNLKSKPEVSDFINSYKKYYSETALKTAENDADNLKENINDSEEHEKTNNSESDLSNEVPVKKKTKSRESEVKKILVEENLSKDAPPTKKKKSKKQKRASLNTSSTSDWDIGLLDNDNIDVIFDKLKKKMGDKLKKEGNKIQKQLAPSKSSNKKRKQNENTEEKESLLALPIEKKRPRIDEPLLYTSEQEEPLDKELTDLNNILKKKNNKASSAEKDKVSSTGKKNAENTNTKQKKKVTELDTIIPDIITNMDDDDDNDDIIQRELKEEAADVFQTDLVEEFAKEKAETIEKNKPKDINLMLPGWGSWGGVGVVPSKRKQRRFIIKAPKKLPRRDDNKGFLVINEEAEKKVKDHMVDELPFPFQRVKDFEASIRAPIGREFVPETAFRKLTKPAVRTKIGAIIAPMDKDVLLNKMNL